MKMIFSFYFVLFTCDMLYGKYMLFNCLKAKNVDLVIIMITLLS